MEELFIYQMLYFAQSKIYRRLNAFKSILLTEWISFLKSEL